MPGSRWPCQVKESGPAACDRFAKHGVWHLQGVYETLTATCVEHFDPFCKTVHVIRTVRLSESLPPPPSVGVTVQLPTPVRRSA